MDMTSSKESFPPNANPTNPSSNSTSLVLIKAQPAQGIPALFQAQRQGAHGAARSTGRAAGAGVAVERLDTGGATTAKGPTLFLLVGAAQFLLVLVGAAKALFGVVATVAVQLDGFAGHGVAAATGRDFARVAGLDQLGLLAVAPGVEGE
ncbi:uncharacterized protein TRUGW13939_01977 [Talaromyces rugulosus]|uniref:Uncharacterized protein n=1 Tax=Talaromyces rugulosus TaxID=121627 RepID=A0A7H8QLS4_TALRU|nr:uncharacterized protein TRUGW13939_01977 [Talaromyces rugulosus]QKX54887.1 hypothetical protein TRUGW13939_01977 [Talaromyces rugulosus]